MPQLDLGQVVGPQGVQGPEGPSGPEGIQGPAGAPATINGVNALTIVGGDNVQLSQTEGTVTLSVPTGEANGVAGLDESGAVPVSQGGTGSSTAQAALDALGAGVRPNLLINGNLSVNQRGQSSYSFSSRSYFVDGWQADPNLTITVLSGGGCTFQNTLSSGTGNAYILQTTEIAANDVLNKTMTASILADGILYSASLLISSTNNANTDTTTPFGLLRVQVVNGIVRVSLGFSIGQSATITDVKLEEGPNQTLAYQDDTGAWHRLPQPEDGDYTGRLAKCEYFFRRLQGGNYIGLAFATSTTLARFFVFGTPMRLSRPTIDLLNAVLVPSGGSLSSGITITAANSYGNTNNPISVDLTASGLTPGQVYAVGIASGGYIDLEAQL